jgi:hypothetical protein
MAWALILLILIAFGMVAFVAMARRGAVERGNDPTEAMDADSRSLYSPVRRLTEEIEELAGKQDSVTARVVGTEAAQEAKRIREQCARALIARTSLVRASRGEAMANLEIQKLDSQVAAATNESEKAALQGAKEARQMELAHYTRAREALERIDGGVRQAVAVLSEMKTRLAVGSGSEKLEAAGEDDLRETIGRLKTLSVSYDEAEQALRSDI